MGWTEITSQYAGLFFRVLGAGSAAFGSVQEENSPRLTDVASFAGSAPSGQVSVPIGSWSFTIRSGGSSGSLQAMQFRASGGEVRPRNGAVRIWRRT